MTDSTAHCYGDDYQTHFNVAAYLAKEYASAEGDDPHTEDLLILNKKWVETFASGEVAGKRLLEFGCGPCIHTVIPSSRRFDEIYMCEYGAPNRQAIRDWIDKKPTAHDWTPFFKFFAEREGQGATHQEIEARLRGKIKGIAPCDFNKDNPFEPNHFDPEFFDCITSSFCLEPASQTEDDYKAGLKKLNSYLKPGGYLVMCGALYEHQYPVGDQTFNTIYMTPELMKESLKGAGFVDINLTEYEVIPTEAFKSDATGQYFLTCTKKK